LINEIVKLKNNIAKQVNENENKKILKKIQDVLGEKYYNKYTSAQKSISSNKAVSAKQEKLTEEEKEQIQRNKEKNANFKDIQNTTKEEFLSIENLKDRILEHAKLNIADSKIADWLTNQKKDINDEVNEIKDYPNKDTAIYSKN
jgi:hypothetical protein